VLNGACPCLRPYRKLEPDGNDKWTDAATLRRRGDLSGVKLHLSPLLRRTTHTYPSRVLYQSSAKSLTRGTCWCGPDLVGNVLCSSRVGFMGVTAIYCMTRVRRHPPICRNRIILCRGLTPDWRTRVPMQSALDVDPGVTARRHVAMALAGLAGDNVAAEAHSSRHGAAGTSR
jgi:hypothetical protein